MQTLFDDTLASTAQLLADDALDPQTLAGGCQMTLEPHRPPGARL